MYCRVLIAAINISSGDNNVALCCCIGIFPGHWKFWLFFSPKGMPVSTATLPSLPASSQCRWTSQVSEFHQLSNCCGILYLRTLSGSTRDLNFSKELNTESNPEAIEIPHAPPPPLPLSLPRLRPFRLPCETVDALRPPRPQHKAIETSSLDHPLGY